MSANYVLLEKITVGAAGAASVTFSNIPQTGYTDLIVKYTGRANDNGVTDGFALLFNGSTTNYTGRQLSGNGSTATSVASTGTRWAGVNGTAATANTFANGEFYIPNYTSSNYKTYTLDYVIENNSSTKNMALSGVLWSDNAAVTSIELIDSGKTLLQHCTFYLYGIAKLGTTPTIAPKATGGNTIMTDGTYWYHAFRSSGTFTPAKGLSCDYLVIAGGGGGGNAGGGAGGYRTATAQSLTTTAYTVTVGAGGAAFSGGAAGNGSSSTFNTLTSTGGGGGGGNGGSGSNGGSGGGAAVLGSTVGSAGTGTAGQGNNGGSGSAVAPGNYVAAGGGGAGAIGGSTSGTTCGAGGAGSNAHSTWASVTGTGVSGYYAGGGGAAGNATTSSGGSGGGGNGDNASTGNGVANTGSGGGGGYSTYIGAGGSGLVIVRYPV
jgi:hypothetical protein